MDYLYDKYGNAIGMINNNRIYDMNGHFSGQLDGTHIHSRDGSYVGEFNNGMALDMFQVRTPLIPSIPDCMIPPVPPIPRIPFPSLYNDVSDDLFDEKW